jgi:hypothetical protein
MSPLGNAFKKQGRLCFYHQTIINKVIFPPKIKWANDSEHSDVLFRDFGHTVQNMRACIFPSQA